MLDSKKHPKLYAYFKFKDDCQQVFGTEAGRRLLTYLMKVGCVTTPAASENPDLTQQNVGAQRLVLSLIKATYKNEDALAEKLIDAYEKEEVL